MAGRLQLADLHPDRQLSTDSVGSERIRLGRWRPLRPESFEGRSFTPRVCIPTLRVQKSPRASWVRNSGTATSSTSTRLLGRTWSRHQLIASFIFRGSRITGAPAEYRRNSCLLSKLVSRATSTCPRGLRELLPCRPLPAPCLH